MSAELRSSAAAPGLGGARSGGHHAVRRQLGGRLTRDEGGATAPIAALCDESTLKPGTPPYKQGYIHRGSTFSGCVKGKRTSFSWNTFAGTGLLPQRCRGGTGFLGLRLVWGIKFEDTPVWTQRQSPGSFLSGPRFPLRQCFQPIAPVSGLKEPSNRKFHLATEPFTAGSGQGWPLPCKKFVEYKPKIMFLFFFKLRNLEKRSIIRNEQIWTNVGNRQVRFGRVALAAKEFHGAATEPRARSNSAVLTFGLGSGNQSPFSPHST